MRDVQDVTARVSEASLSVIVPSLNEQEVLSRTLHGIASVEQTELIVVDGGSHDATVEVAREMGARVVYASPGRAHQMNVGARSACGETLLFLHADTRLPAGFSDYVRNTLATPGVVAGAFRFALDDDGIDARMIEWLVALRCRWFGVPYGDQALFMSGPTFRRLGGFPEVPVMEDFELVRRLRRQGSVKLAPAYATTSARRWREWGVIRVTTANQLSLVARLVGISSERVSRFRRAWVGG